MQQDEAIHQKIRPTYHHEKHISKSIQQHNADIYKLYTDGKPTKSLLSTVMFFV